MLGFRFVSLLASWDHCSAVIPPVRGAGTLRLKLCLPPAMLDLSYDNLFPHTDYSAGICSGATGRTGSVSHRGAVCHWSAPGRSLQFSFITDAALPGARSDEFG